MLEQGPPSLVVEPVTAHGQQGLHFSASCPGSLIALHVSSPVFLLCAACASPVLSTQLDSLATHMAAGARGLLLFLESW